MTQDNYPEQYKLMDAVLANAPEHEIFNIDTLIADVEANGVKYEAQVKNQNLRHIMVHEHEYVEQYRGMYQQYRLTALGLEVKKAGGRAAWLQKQQEKAAQDARRQELNDKKLEYDVKNAKRVFKTYWFTFIIALVGFILSIILSVLKLIQDPTK